ncbi:hypothetical protein [Microterricola viridarii]|uniref:Uncharacterized protein n=1 Tax=Microterricola viridarii TaxID=412690 RepID=A0A1H1Y3F9_9MICO|nr:hypothetical protein [Microterricola viridarii]SDT15931.1 hypothetical protein SAMN04489834_2965 [Microterricola viridarii]
MSQQKKSRSTGPKSRPSRPASPSGQAHRGARETPSTAEARLLAQFATWYARHLTEIDDAESHGSLESMHGTLGVLMEMTRTLGPRMTLATPTARTLQALLDYVIELGRDGAAPAETARADLDASDEDELDLRDRVEALVEVLEHYLDFLSETRSWRASDADFDAAYDVLDDAIAEYTPVGEMVGLLLDALTEVEQVPPAEQLQALDALPIVQGVDGLLAWVGRGRPILRTGALQLADIQTVAALIGINAVGQPGAENTDLAHHLYEMATAGTPGAFDPEAEPRQAGSMWDLSDLSAWWAALAQSGITEVTATTVRPGPTAAQWQAADATERLAARTELIDNYVQEWLDSEAENEAPTTAQTLTRIIAVLAGAICPAALPAAGSAEIAELVDAELDFEANATASFAASLVLHQLSRAGLFEARSADDGTERLLVPAALRPALAAVVGPLAASLV